MPLKWSFKPTIAQNKLVRHNSSNASNQASTIQTKLRQKGFIAKVPKRPISVDPINRHDAGDELGLVRVPCVGLVHQPALQLADARLVVVRVVGAVRGDVAGGHADVKGHLLRRLQEWCVEVATKSPVLKCPF